MNKRPQTPGLPRCPRHNPPKVMAETEIKGVFACECGNQLDRRPRPMFRETRLSRARRTRRGV